MLLMCTLNTEVFFSHWGIFNEYTQNNIYLSLRCFSNEYPHDFMGEKEQETLGDILYEISEPIFWEK